MHSRPLARCPAHQMLGRSQNSLTSSSCTCAGINDFPNGSAEDIKKALPFLKKAGVPYYVHAELEQNASAPVRCARRIFPDPMPGM